MTPQEINEAVARKLGWYALKWRDEPGKHPAWWGLNQFHQVESLIPDYCHFIAAAWEVVEKCFRVKMEKFSDEWQCELGDGKHGDEFASADTAPMAICLAFLKLQ